MNPSVMKLRTLSCGCGPRLKRCRHPAFAESTFLQLSFCSNMVRTIARAASALRATTNGGSMEHTPNEFVTTPQPNLPARYELPCSDGWTVARQDIFLKALAACGCVSDACRSVGMSRESAYELYNRPAAAAFRAAWDAAHDCATPLIEGGAWERAIKGVSRPIFYKGEQVGEYRHYDERLDHVPAALSPAAPLSRPAPAAGYPPARLGPGRSRPRRRRSAASIGTSTTSSTKPSYPAALSEASRANDGVNFVNFVGNDADQDRHAELGSSIHLGTGNARDRMDPERVQGDGLPFRAFAPSRRNHFAARARRMTDFASLLVADRGHKARTDPPRR